MNSPTLLVGLGGTGSKIVAKVSELISEQQRRNISCVIFDTDANDIPILKEEHPEIRVVQTSARMTVGEYLEADHHARDTWFPVNPPLDRKVLSEGAGQVRSISRLGFESAMRAGKLKPLQEAIDALYKVDNQKVEQALRVTIVSSLAGGTGSGLIVPVAMYIRQYLEDRMPHNANISRGFFILPEVFYSAIPEDQRNNLKSNAYASLRELDAFLMKGNGTLSEEYSDSVKLELPDLDTDKPGQRREYDIAPYDFCFLYDAQNADGEKLNSLEQYMDHAANILYAMSVGPMNKRSNSSEDNVIRKLAKEKGRNRYAGAGASRLIYPYKDICRLVGLNWAAQNVSNQWLEYDKQIDQKLAVNRKRREEGYMTDEIDVQAEYASIIETESTNRKPFAMAMHRSVEGEKEGAESLDEIYLKAIDDQIKKSINQKLDGCSKKVEKLLKSTEGKDLDEVKNTLSTAEKAAKTYKGEAVKYLETQPINLAHSLFEGGALEGTTDSKFFIEGIIQTKNGYLHPNAIRYLLIKIKRKMEERLDATQQEGEKKKKSFEAIDKPTYSNLGDGAGTLANFQPKKGLFSKQKNLDTLDQVKRKIEIRQEAAEEYVNAVTTIKVYTHGIQYLDSLIEGFEAFYKALSTQIAEIDRKKEQIYKKYTQAPGMTVRYVAASRECLEEIVRRNPYKGSMISIDSDLSRDIATQVFQYAKMVKKPNSSVYFSDLFENQILAHYQKQVDKTVAATLDQGVMKALELEADLLLREDLRYSSSAVDQYVRSVLSSTRSLAKPFIEKPSELSTTIIDACAFNTSLKPERGDESYEARLVQEELVDRGGSPDEDIDRNTILFYQSYYGLRANGLSKFAPPRISETHKRSGGEYFKAYMDLIHAIHPNSRKSQEITPHIDKSWHLAAKMPDLDEGNQIIEEYAINAAFFWALVLDLLDLKTESNGKNIFSLKEIRLGLDEGTLLADGVNPSSKLYEVLQALALQPQYVKAIRHYAHQLIEADVAQPRPIREGNVYQQLENINVPVEAHYRGYQGRVTQESQGVLRGLSLLELPVLIKQSLPLGVNRDEKLLELVTVGVKEVVNYLSNFCSPEELSKEVGLYMSAQYAPFDQWQTDPANTGVDLLMANTLDTVANTLDEFSLYELAQQMRNRADGIKNAN